MSDASDHSAVGSHFARLVGLLHYMRIWLTRATYTQHSPRVALG